MWVSMSMSRLQPFHGRGNDNRKNLLMIPPSIF
jgi:hypothetical protein